MIDGDLISAWHPKVTERFMETIVREIEKELVAARGIRRVAGSMRQLAATAVGVTAHSSEEMTHRHPVLTP